MGLHVFPIPIPPPTLDLLLKRVDRIESSKEPEAVSASGMSEVAACPASPIADDSSAL